LQKNPVPLEVRDFSASIDAALSIDQMKAKQNIKAYIEVNENLFQNKLT